MFFLVKIHIFWEGHKILRNLHLTFILCSVKSKVKILQNFVAFSEYMNLIMTSVRLWSLGLETFPVCLTIQKVATIWFSLWDGPNCVVGNLTFLNANWKITILWLAKRFSEEIKWTWFNSLLIFLPFFGFLNHSYLVLIPITLCQKENLCCYLGSNQTP